MAAVRKIHPEDLIAVLNRREIHGHVRLRAAVWLHVRVIGPEQFLRAIDRGLLDHISPFTAAVVTFTGIAFGILVSEDRTHGFEHSFANKIL